LRDRHYAELLTFLAYQSHLGRGDLRVEALRLRFFLSDVGLSSGQ
jgi:hypothetical protein